MNIQSFSRHDLIEGPTPIQFLPRMSAHLGGAKIYVKRDDLNGVGGGGNKLRKLEFLIGDALATGADTIITVGARQSNHARLTAAASARAGLACELVLTRTVQRFDDDYLYNGNILLADLFGARVHDLPASADALDFAEQRACELRRQGRKIYVCPLGGSSAIGCLGYAACMEEIAVQSEASNVTFDRIIVPNGSGGTHAGLVAGCVALGRDPSVIVGFSVYSDSAQAHDTTLKKANETTRLISADARVRPSDVFVDDGQLGASYGQPTPAMSEAVRLMASMEGLLLDPVYSGKAFAGLIERVRTRAVNPEENVLFLMTGGLPGLFAYRRAFLGDEQDATALA
jgi:L-cysteate sulfo-lyase